MSDKKFSSIGDLKKHERIHINEKPFSCSMCALCNQSSALRGQKRIHTNVKPFSCSKCDKKFTQAGNLK